MQGHPQALGFSAAWSRVHTDVDVLQGLHEQMLLEKDLSKDSLCYLADCSF